MSKKSRKRNKKILAALALAGGAAMLAKGRGKGIAQGVSGADKAAFTSDAAYKLPSKAAVAADIAQDVVSPAVTDRVPIGKMRGTGTDLQAIANQKKRAALNLRAPTDVMGPFDYMQPRVPRPNRFGRINAKGGGIAKRGNGAAYKSGGRTGKQFGGGLNRPVARPVGGVGGVGAPVRPLAYKHGGKVKSMGVAKRGGGIAKR